MKKNGFVKISSGMFKGIKVLTPGEGTHPMGERERIALFNLVGNDWREKKVLDAYAGGGTLGFEAMSRGALWTVFVEKSTQAIDLIRDNLDHIDAVDTSERVSNVQVTRCDVRDFEPIFQLDLIIVDPPYDKFETEGAEHLVQFLSDDGLFVLSHPNEAPEIKGLKLIKTRKYARAHLSVYAE